MQRLSLAAFFFATVVRRNKRIAIDSVNPQDTRVAIVIIFGIRNFFHAVNSLCYRFPLRRLIHDGHILYDFGRIVQCASLVQPQSRHIGFRSRITVNRVFDIVVPSIEVQEVIAVRQELLVHHLELSSRFVRLDGIFFLLATVLRRNRREFPVAQFPFRLDTEEALMVFGITRKLRTGQRQVRSTRFHALQDVIFEFALERFLINNADFVL